MTETGRTRSARSETGNSALDAARRSRELAELGDGAAIDLLVIGGGITGVGIALDASARGLRTVLVERHDLAFGTSRWSSKLVHGGLRYLAGGHLGIARESAVERGILLERTAPHLVRALPQLVPATPNIGRLDRALVRAGFLAGDALRRTAGTSAQVLPRSRRVTAAEAIRWAPTVQRAGLHGGFLAWDGQLVDDARLVVAIARTAAAYGARILTRVEAVDVSGDSATLRDTMTDDGLAVRPRAVVNATGVWAGEVDPTVTLRPSRGTHLVFDAATFGGLRAALTVPVPGETGRFVFAMPSAHGRVYLGLTDEDAPGPIPDLPNATDAEIDFLLATVNQVLQEPLTRNDVRGSFAGLRPLLVPADAAPGDIATADLSRKHAVLESPSGLITIVGGKLTAYRKMAEDAVDAAVVGRGLDARPCRTRNLPLVGAVAGAGRDAVAAPVGLVERYGGEAVDVLALAEADPRLHAPVADGIDVCKAEFAFAISHEGALDIGDLLDRRTRIGLVAEDRERATAAALEAVGNP